MKRFFLIFGLVIIYWSFFAVGNAKAYRIENLKDVNNTGDFDIGPTIFYLKAKPGDILHRTLQVTSRDGKTSDYYVETEDFQGSDINPDQTHSLLGTGEGKYGAKDWIETELNDFSISHGERLFFDITINVPKTADPGDHYVAVLVSRKPDPNSKTAENAPNVVITSRAGALFFITVEGDIKEEGRLEDFTPTKNIFTKLPTEFSVIFRDTGTVHLIPSGKIEIKNIFGQTVETIMVTPFNVLRDSVRGIKFSSKTDDSKIIFGYYRADLSLNRSYGDIVDTMSCNFWYIPWPATGIVLGIILLLILAYKFMRMNFAIQVRRKKRR